MDDEMAGTKMKPHAITGVSGGRSRFLTKYFVIWRSDEFSWAGRTIPHMVLPGSTSINTTKLDEAVEKEMRSSELPSLSISVHRRGQTILSISYGYSDLRLESRASPKNKYRVASISKTITAMGIAELVNRRHISLDSKVFGAKGILKWLDVSRAHPWIRAVTVGHLLEHSSGGWSNQEKLEFNRTPQTERLNGTALLEFYIRSYNPKFQPGRRYLYSNIAYVFLGKVIEQTTLSNYSAFISDVILKPHKIEAQIGDVEPIESEVSYYSPDNANPYTYWSPSKLDAAAGWVMRAEEVARLFALLELHKYKWYWLLVQPSEGKRSYGRGVQLGDDGSLYHIGSLAGTEGIGYSRGETQVNHSFFPKML
ncbi:hypothetical protein V3C99_014874 [Haemonchus contortus]|uniref:Beta-lactamase-related domain-containing protein n=1 Tax=Haemonchus contortus TaxID=6289 RepID=A0A912MYE4_HAECO